MIRHSWLVILAVYGVSFALPVWAGVPGLAAFLWGAYGMFAFKFGSVDFLACTAWWLANPALWIGLVLLAKERWGGAVLAGTVAALLAAVPLLDRSSSTMLRSGYVALMSSMLLLAVMGLVGRIVDSSHDVKTKGPMDEV